MKKVYGVLLMTLLKNVVYFDVDNSSSSYIDNLKNNFFSIG